MLHLALQGVLSRRTPPFPLLHVDTTGSSGRCTSFATGCTQKYGLRADRPHQPGGRRAGHQPVHARLGDPHRREEDAGAEAGARQVRLRRGLRRRAPRRGEEPRQGAHLLVPHARSTAGIRRTSARSSGASTTRASTRARASACSRSRTGPSSTSGSTSTCEDIPIVPLYFAAERPVVERDGTLIMVDDDRMPLQPGEKPMLKKVRFRTLGCYPLTGAIESEADTLPAIIQEMLLTTHVGAAGPRHRPRPGGVDGEEEAGGVLLMAHIIRPDRRGHRGVPARARAQEPAALHHLRQRRRRQEHADRPPALRLEDDLRGPARGARGRLEEGRHAGRRARLRAAGRRPRRRARAGHHDRRRLPLLLHRQAQVHRRRHAGPRAVHAQHGHRRLDRRPRRDPDRRAQGRADADAPAQLPRLAARHPQGRAGGQQDGPGRLLRRTIFDAIVDDYRAFAAADRARRHSSRSRCRRCKGDNVTDAEREHALVPRPDADGVPRDGRDRGRARSSGRSGCRCSGSTARTSTSAASPARIASGAVQAGRRDPRAAVGPREHASRASSRMDGDLDAGGRRPVGHAHARRRDRHQPRRRASRRPDDPPGVADQFEATIVWMARRADAAGPALPG